MNRFSSPAKMVVSLRRPEVVNFIGAYNHVQVDVKVLLLKDLFENEYKRFQYTTIDDATRVRAL